MFAAHFYEAEVGAQGSSIALRRGLVVPTRECSGSVCRPQKFSQTKASRASARAGMAASVKRGSISTGKSFREWTARSMRPAARASSISLIKMPVPLGERPSGGTKAGSLHAVADGADDVDFDGVAVLTQLRGDVVGLPERELRAARTDTDCLNAHIF